MKYTDLADDDCSIAQALSIVGDWWTLLVVRDVAGGTHRFDDLQRALELSRKVLTERLAKLVEHDVLVRRPYSSRPPRFEYHLTAKGHGLVPVLIALQDWGTRFVMSDGSLTATEAPQSREAQRVHSLAGQRLPIHKLTGHDTAMHDLVGPTPLTVVYCFAGAAAPNTHFYPPGWGDIPGAVGCTLEATTYRDRLEDFTAAGATVRGISTQRPDELAAFADHAKLPFTLLSDSDLELSAALRLPTFRAGGADRMKRLTMVVDQDRVIRHVQYPVPDPAGSVLETLAFVRG